MSCEVTFTAQELYDRGTLVTLNVPYLPAYWPRCPECFGKLERGSPAGICDWRCVPTDREERP